MTRTSPRESSSPTSSTASNRGRRRRARRADDRRPRAASVRRGAVAREAGERRRVARVRGGVPGVHHRRALRSASARGRGRGARAHDRLAPRPARRGGAGAHPDLARRGVRRPRPVLDAGGGHPGRSAGMGAGRTGRELSTASRCVCETAPPMPPSSALPDDAPLRIAWLVYRGNPHCGGQGVYTRYLARELADLGHEVTVFSGQPYPELDDPSAAGEGPRPRPLRRAAPVLAAVAVGDQVDDRPPRVRDHVRRRVPRAVHVQPARPPAPAAPPRRLRHRARQPVPRHRPAHDDARRRLAGALHAAPPDHRRPRPRPRARDDARTAASCSAVGTASSRCRCASHARSRGSSPCRSRAGATSSRRWTCPPTGCTSFPSAWTRRSSGRCPMSRACAGG